MKEVNDWFKTGFGQRVLESEQRVLEQLLPGFFGYHLLQLSSQSSSLFDSSVIQHKLKLTAGNVSSDQFKADVAQLPFEEDSLDVVLLHHLLEFHSDPQSLLREVSRVALPMGQLVIVGFNPHSLWGLGQPIGRLRKKLPWTGRFISPGRMMDWLNLLSFKIDRAQYCLYGLPSANSNAKLPDYSQGLSRNANWPFGGVYIIVARKQVGSMINMRPVWQASRPFRGLSVVQPARPTAGRNVSRDLPSGD